MLSELISTFCHLFLINYVFNLHEFHAHPWLQKIRVPGPSCGVVCTFAHFDRTPTWRRDRQTDRQTESHSTLYILR